MKYPGSVAAKIEASTAFQTDPEILVSNAYRTAEIPAGNGHGNARSVARIASIFSNHGECDGKRFLKTETIDRVLEEQIYVRDHMFGRPVRYGLGMGLSSKEFPLPNPNSLHWGGFGGSFCIMDLDANISVAYAMNRMFVSNGVDPRLTNLRKALFTCMPKVTA